MVQVADGAVPQAPPACPSSELPPNFGYAYVWIKLCGPVEVSQLTRARCWGTPHPTHT